MLLSRVFRFRRRCGLVPFRAECRNCLPCGSFPFGVFPVVGSHLTPKVYHSLGSVASSAFRALSRPYSARYLPALFHAGPALGVSPFRVLRRPQSDPLFRASLPSCGSRALISTASIGLESVSFPRSLTFSSRSLMIRRLSELVPLQGFNPCGRLLFPPELFVQDGNSRPSWASSSLGVLPSCRRVFLGTRPLVSFSPLAPVAMALQSLPRKKLG